jgi:hypothetical protein
MARVENLRAFHRSGLFVQYQAAVLPNQYFRGAQSLFDFRRRDSNIPAHPKPTLIALLRIILPLFAEQQCMNPISVPSCEHILTRQFDLGIRVGSIRAG